MKILIRRFVPFSISYSIVILSVCLLSYVNGITHLPLNTLWGIALIVAFIQTVDILLYQVDFRKAWHLYTVEYIMIFTVSFLLGSLLFKWYHFELEYAITMGIWTLLIYIIIILFFKHRNKLLAVQINQMIQNEEKTKEKVLNN